MCKRWDVVFAGSKLICISNLKFIAFYNMYINLCGISKSRLSHLHKFFVFFIWQRFCISYWIDNIDIISYYIFSNNSDFFLHQTNYITRQTKIPLLSHSWKLNVCIYTVAIFLIKARYILNHQKIYKENVSHFFFK